MATDARIRRALLLAALAGTMLVAFGPAGSGASSTSSATARAGSFPCRFNWSLFDGLKRGYVTAGNNADCRGRRGSLTLGIRLLRLDPATKVWRTDRKKTRTFRNLRANRGLEIAEPCAPATFRAIFRWTLRDPSGAAVARHTVRSGSLVVVDPDCQVMLR